RHAEALPDCERALEYDNGRDRDAIRISRAEVLARAGEHARAAAEVKDLARGKSLSGGDFYNLTCVYSLAMAAVSADSKPSPAERSELINTYAAGALELLTKASTAGHFKDRGNIDRMRKEKALDLLRSRDEFKKLFADLEKP